MKESFWGLVWQSFDKVQGIIFGIFSLIFAIILWNLSPDWRIEVFWVILVFPILFFISIAFGNLAYRLYKTQKNKLPKVLLGKELEMSDEESKTICLLGSSDLFSHNCVVSIYFNNQGFEQLVGIGIVQNIQEDGKIQIIINYPIPSHKDIIEKISQNEGETIKNLIIKPHTSLEYLAKLITGGQID